MSKLNKNFYNKNSSFIQQKLDLVHFFFKFIFRFLSFVLKFICLELFLLLSSLVHDHVSS